MHWLSAVTVPQLDRRARGPDHVPVAPLQQRHQDRVKVQALVREPVFIPAALTALLVGHLAEQALIDQAAKPLAEYLPRYGSPALHVIEAADSVEDLAQHQERGALSDDPDRRADGAVGRVVIQNPGSSHDRMLGLVDRLSKSGHAGCMIGTQVAKAAPYPAAVIRPVRPADLAALSDFFAGLSMQSRYQRFFAPVTPGPALLRILSGSAGATVDAMIAITDGGIVGHAMAADRAVPLGGRTTDIGVAVADAWQGRSVGSALMHALIPRARARGVTSLTMDVLPGNHRVLAMITGHWPTARIGRAQAHDTVCIRLPQWERSGLVGPADQPVAGMPPDHVRQAQVLADEGGVLRRREGRLSGSGPDPQ